MKSAPEHYEILVIGSGEAGEHITWNFAQAGRSADVFSFHDGPRLMLGLQGILSKKKRPARR